MFANDAESMHQNFRNSVEAVALVSKSCSDTYQRCALHLGFEQCYLQASAYKDAQLLSLKEMIPPSDPGDPIRVAMLVVLGPGFQGEALLRSAQTAFQQLQTTIGQGA